MPKPQVLKPGDKVAVVAPAGPFDRAIFERGLAVLSSRYQPVYSEGIFAQHRYFAGFDARRLAELTEALTDDSIRAVFCVRGGYGSMRLLPRLEVRKLGHKPLVGFSDITALHALFQSHRRASIHGPVLTQLGNQPPESVDRLFQLLEGVHPALPLTGTNCLIGGSAEGTLVGGNLSVFTRLLGTPYLPTLKDAVLLLEDVGERPYRVDRMWQHLSLAGVFQQVAGIVLGDFTECDERDGAMTGRETLKGLAEETGIPCASGFPIGHGDINLAVPLGCKVRLDADSAKLMFLEPFAEERDS